MNPSATTPGLPKMPPSQPIHSSKYAEGRRRFCSLPFFHPLNPNFRAVLSAFVKEKLIRLGPINALEVNNCQILKIIRKPAPLGFIDVSLLMSFRDEQTLPPAEGEPERLYESYMFYFTYPDPENGAILELYDRKSACVLARQQQNTLEDINARVDSFWKQNPKEASQHWPNLLSSFLEPVFINDRVSSRDVLQAEFLALCGGVANEYRLYDPRKSDMDPEAHTPAFYSLFKLRRETQVPGGSVIGGFLPLSTCFKYLQWLTESAKDISVKNNLNTLISGIAGYQCLLFSAYNTPGLQQGLPGLERRIGNMGAIHTRQVLEQTGVEDEDGTYSDKYTKISKRSIGEDVTRKLNPIRLSKFDSGRVSNPSWTEEREQVVRERAELMGPYSNVFIWFDNRIADLLIIFNRQSEDSPKNFRRKGGRRLRKRSFRRTCSCRCLEQGHGRMIMR